MIRPATTADAPAIAALLQAAFAGPAEAALVQALRAEGAVACELVAETPGGMVAETPGGMVAETPGGMVAGHVLLSRMWLGDAPGLALAPLAVAAGMRRQGIGAALVRRALAEVAGEDAGWCLVLGEPAYYARFGFTPAPSVTGVPWAGHPAFQALSLQADPAAPCGPAQYARAFGA